MQPTQPLFRIILVLLAAAGLSFFSACKKNGKEGPSDELPVLGTCDPVPVGSGLMSQGNGIYEYRSAGGVVFKMQRLNEGLTITMTDNSYPNTVTYQLWGISPASEIRAALYENLNGKHVKNRIGNNRTIFFPDGTKITCVAAGPEKSITAVSIYDGATAHHLNINCDKVEYSRLDAALAKRLDDQQPDGETSTYELTSTGLTFFNIYTENTPGNKVEQRIDLGKLYSANPNRVDDLYDDPRLDHT